MVLVAAEVDVSEPNGHKSKRNTATNMKKRLVFGLFADIRQDEYPNEIGITTPIGGSLLDCEVGLC